MNDFSSDDKFVMMNTVENIYGTWNLIGSKDVGYEQADAIDVNFNIVNMYKECEFKDEKYHVICFSGPWEGEGGIALYIDGSLYMKLHFEDSETFYHVNVVDETVFAKSSDYNEYDWIIPIKFPVKIQVVCKKSDA